MIGDGVMVTAAHVVYNEDTFQWIAPSLIQYFPRSDSNDVWFGRTRYNPVAIYRWDDYSSRVRNDESGEGFSTPNTFNMDFAVGYFSAATNDTALREHAEVHVDPEGEVTIHRHPREKMIVGYPQDSDYIPAGQLGRMHRTAPGDYHAEESIDNQELPGYDFGNTWASVYYYFDVATYGGGSGGPVYVRDDRDDPDNWMMAGAAVGGTGSTISLVRSIDDNAWSGIGQEGMIQQAVIARNGNAMRRVEDLEATFVTDNAVSLQWTDLSTQETGYSVFRQETGLFEEIASLPANSERFLDDTIEAGKVYHYQVQPYRILPDTEHINKPPKSPQLAVDIPGTHTEAAEFLDAGLLKLTSSGNSSWYVDPSNRLRAGLVRPMSSSSLFLDIIGPGTLTFDWSASSEVNEHYTNNNPQDPDSKYFGLIYDAIWLYVNNDQVKTGDEPVFLSGPLPDDPTGIISASGIRIDISSGPHRIEWRYEKDPYSDDHLDTAFLDALSWEPATEFAYPVYGGYAVANPDWVWHASAWFGAYEARHWPWVEHEQLGWLYMISGTADKGVYFHCHHPELGYLYTSPGLWPYLYKPASGTWVYYYEDSGTFGQGAVFFDFGQWRTIRMDNR